MSTTTKRKRDEDEDEGPPNKKIKSTDASELSLQLIPELWLHILVFIPNKEISPIRLVCRQWNKMTYSKDYGKALCIMKFGHDIGPLKINNLAALSKVADSELVFIPTIQEESRLIVDWFAYYNLRYVDPVRSLTCLLTTLRVLLRKSIRDITYNSKEKLPLDADLTCSVITKTINIAENERIETCSLNHLLLKLIPVLIQYERLELAYDAVSLVVSIGYQSSRTPKYIDQLLDLYEVLASVKFPYFCNDIFEMACNKANCFYATTNLEGQKKSFCERVFPRLLRTIIKQGSDGSGHSPDIGQIVRFQDSARFDFPLIFKRLSQDTELDNALHSVIVPICQKEFESSDDWHTKESALLAACSSHCALEEYSHECVRFATNVLSNDQHQLVIQAAVVLLCSKLVHSRVKLQSQEEFNVVFERLIWALFVVQPQHALNVLNGLVSILVPMAHSVSETQLDLFHASLFKVVLIPDVIRKSMVNDSDALDDKICYLASTFQQRFLKYLPLYRETYLKLASLGSEFLHVLTSAQLVACYLHIGRFIDPENFYCEAVDILQQVQDGTIGFDVDVANFYFYCSIESLTDPTADRRAFIASVMRLYPNEVIKPLHEDCLEQTAVENDQNDHHGPAFPDYIPHFKHQYEEAVEQAHLDPLDWPKLFEFSPKGSTVTVCQPNLIPLEHFKKILDSTVCLDGVATLIHNCTELVKSTDPEEVQLLKEWAPKILSLIINYMHMDLFTMRPKWLCGAKLLLQEISENFPSHVTCCYMAVILDTLNRNCMIESSFQQEKETILYSQPFLQICHSILLKLADPPVDLLSKFFHNLFRFKPPCGMTWTDKLKTLEDIILQWPRTAWTVLCNATVAKELLNNQPDPKRREYEYGSIMVQRLLMKYYGYKRVAALISELRDMNVSVGYFYESVLSYKQRLAELGSYDRELWDQARIVLPKFATFCRLYHIDKNAGEVCFFNQFTTDQSNIGQILNTINPELVTEELNGNYFSLFF